MPDFHFRLKASGVMRALVAVAAIGLLFGCTGGSTGDTAKTPNGAPSEVDGSSSTSPSTLEGEGEEDSSGSGIRAMPVDSVVEQIVGYSDVEVYEALNTARFDSIIDCMTAEGWEFGYEDLPEPGASTGVGYLGTQVTHFQSRIADLDAQPAGDDSDAESTDSLPEIRPPEFYEDQTTCFMVSEDAFPDPAMALWSWMAEEMADVYERTYADDRVISAFQHANVCLREGGYDFPTIEAGGAYFTDTSYEIWEAVSADPPTMTTAAALSAIDALALQAAGFDEVATACFVEAALVEERVQAEYEEQWLEANRDRVVLAAEEYAKRLDMYADFLVSVGD